METVMRQSNALWRRRASGENQAGFSLIEVVIAIVILLAILIPISGLLNEAFASSASAKYRDVAERIAQSDLAEMQEEVNQQVPLYDYTASNSVYPIPFLLPDLTGTAPAWPPSEQPLVSVVDGQTYRQWFAVGLCNPANPSTGSTPSSVGNATNVLISYAAVKVVWGEIGVSLGSQAPPSDSIVAYRVLVPGTNSPFAFYSYYYGPGLSIPIVYCPAGLS